MAVLIVIGGAISGNLADYYQFIEKEILLVGEFSLTYNSGNFYIACFILSAEIAIFDTAKVVFRDEFRRVQRVEKKVFWSLGLIQALILSIGETGLVPFVGGAPDTGDILAGIVGAVAPLLLWSLAPVRNKRGWINGMFPITLYFVGLYLGDRLILLLKVGAY